MSAQPFEDGDRVRFVGHADHVAPPILHKKTGATGTVTQRGVGDLYHVKLDTRFGGIVVQFHAEQIEPEEKS